MADRGKPKLRATEAMACGAISGIASRLVISPLDVVKIRLQLQVEPVGKVAQKRVAQYGYYQNWIHALRVIIRDEGVQALFKGNLTADILYFSYGAIQFSIYNEWKSRAGSPLTPIMALIGGGLAGSIATVATYPLDILRTRMAAQGEPRVYPTLRSAIVFMYRNEGWRSFFKGLAPTLAQILPYMSIQFYFYEVVTKAAKNAAVLRKGIPKSEATRQKLSSTEVVICGAIAGAGSKLIVMPFDTIRKRLQVQGFEDARAAFGRVHKYDGFAHCVQTIFRTEGLRGFYKGGVPATLKALLASAATWVTYEKTAEYFKRRHERSLDNRT